MVEVDVTIIVRQRHAVSEELLCSWPPYPSGLNTERHKLHPARRQVSPPLDGLTPGRGARRRRARRVQRCAPRAPPVRMMLLMVLPVLVATRA